MTKVLVKGVIVLVALLVTLVQASTADGNQAFAQQKVSHARSTRKTVTTSPAVPAAEVRHRLIILPLYDVFDWIDGEVKPDGTLVLRGQVVRPTLKADAEKSVSDVAGIKRVVNEIEVLPPSPNDDQLRLAVYRAVYKFDSPLFRYATRAVPPIHIIVKNGRATLKGVVATKADSDLAFMAARGVPGLFDVTNELKAEDQMPR